MIETEAIAKEIAATLNTVHAARGGVVDAVARAEKHLEAIEGRGLIRRTRLQPTRQQVFFGVGGLTGEAAVRHAKLGGWSSTTWWGWEPVTAPHKGVANEGEKK